MFAQSDEAEAFSRSEAERRIVDHRSAASAGVESAAEKPAIKRSHEPFGPDVRAATVSSPSISWIRVTPPG